MSSAAADQFPGFWQIQAAGWGALYALILLPALPHLHQPGILAYNTWAVLLLFAASLALRPVLRYGGTRWNTSWLRLEAFAFSLASNIDAAGKDNQGHAEMLVALTS